MIFASPVLPSSAKIVHFWILEVLRANMWLIFLIGMFIGPLERVQSQSGPLIQFAIRYSFGVGDAVSENGIGESDPITHTRKKTEIAENHWLKDTQNLAKCRLISDQL